MFGLKTGCHYKKIYHDLCVKHEAKLLADAQESFNKHFENVSDRIEAMNLLVTKKNSVEILRAV